MSGLANIGHFTLFIGLDGVAQHRFQTRCLTDIARFDRVDNGHQHGTRGMTQVKAEEDDNDGRQGESPANDRRFVAGDIGERCARDPVDNKPVRIGKRVVVIPGVAFPIIKVAFAAGHFVHQRFAHVLFE